VKCTVAPGPVLVIAPRARSIDELDWEEMSAPIFLDVGRPTIVTATATTAAIRGQRPARPT
jgi:hypothetical protein